MVETAIIKEWLDKAEEDFEFALVNLLEGKPFAAMICFHFHQSAEKYLKAFIVAHDLDFINLVDPVNPVGNSSEYTKKRPEQAPPSSLFGRTYQL